MALRNRQSGFLQSFSGLTDNPKRFCLQTVLIVLIVLTGFWHLKSAFIAQLEMNQGAYMADFVHSLSNPDALANLARKEHLVNADLPLALDLYHMALENFVLHLPSWLGLAEVYNDQGKKVMGIKALEFVHGFAGNTEDLAWSKTLLADSLGAESIMTENLLWLADNRPGRRKDVFTMAELTWKDPQTIMTKFGPRYFMDILNVYIRNDDIGKTWAVWNKIEKTESDTPANALTYIDYLLRQNEFQLAARIWKNSISRDGSLLYNGNFEQPITGSGFGWRVSGTKGVAWERGEYGSGLKITFDGTENPTFYTAQTIPLSPGNYIFSGTYETDSLTTDQRPFWAITGVQCSGLSEKGEMVPPSGQQTEFILRFTVPELCEAVQVSLQRNRSYHFDNKISGSVTINNLRITDAANGASSNGRNGFSSLTDTTAERTQIELNKMDIRP